MAVETCKIESAAAQRGRIHYATARPDATSSMRGRVVDQEHKGSTAVHDIAPGMIVTMDVGASDIFDDVGRSKCSRRLYPTRSSHWM